MGKGRRHGALSLSTVAHKAACHAASGPLEWLPRMRLSQGEPDATRREATRGWRCVARQHHFGRRADRPRQGSPASAVGWFRVSQFNASRRHGGPSHPRRHHRFTGLRVMAGAAYLRLLISVRRNLEPGHRKIRRHRADLRHRRHLAYCHA